jgi:hypothetical protein
MERSTGQTAEFLEFQEWCKENGVKPILTNLVEWMEEKRVKSVKLPESPSSESREVAIEFAEWLRENTFNLYLKEGFKSTTELFDLFLKEKGGKG